MNISKESIRDFQERYQKIFGIEISEKQAQELGQKLLGFYIAIINN